MQQLLDYLRYLATFGEQDKINLLFAFGYMLLERVSPAVKQKLLREDIGHDVTFKLFDTTAHYLMNTLGGALAGLLIFKGLQELFAPLQSALGSSLQLPIRNPLALAILVFFSRDFMGYAIHYAFHRIRVMWHFHAFHHSPVELDWFSGQRGDLLEGVVMEAVISLPMLFLPLTDHQLLLLFIYNKNYEYMIHSNVRYPVRGWGDWIVTNHAHWWHHSAEIAHPYGQNFGYYTLIWDRLFGTYHVEAGMPKALGIPSLKDYPRNFFKRMAYPYAKLFQRRAA